MLWEASLLYHHTLAHCNLSSTTTSMTIISPAIDGQTCCCKKPAHLVEAGGKYRINSLVIKAGWRNRLQQVPVPRAVELFLLGCGEGRPWAYNWPTA